MERISPGVDYSIMRYYGRLVVGPAEDGRSPLVHKWRLIQIPDGSFYIHTASKPVLYMAIEGEPEEYSGIFVRDLPFKWRLEAIAPPNEYLIVPTGFNTNLVLSDLPWNLPRTALVPRMSSIEDVQGQAWVIKKVFPPSGDEEALQSFVYRTCSRFFCCRTAFLSGIL